MSLLCKRCYKTLRSTEGIKCAKCESQFHIKCTDDSKPPLDSGDRKYYWTCATCKRPASKTNLSVDQHDLLDAINSVTEKIELVNKIQLPKLNSDLMQVKLLTERILKQNEDILQQFEQIKKKSEQCSSFQRRNINISPRLKGVEEKPILGESLVRHRTRRRSYPLSKFLVHLNRLRRSRTPRQ